MKQTLEICVCTYRRPQLANTLNSLMALEIPDNYDVQILVIDNDDGPSAQLMVDKMATDAPLQLRYVHCPKGNISIARNGALTHSTARFLAFIDDDEIAPPDWLIHLTQKMAKDDAGVVLGPVEATYPDGAPAWMKRARIHATMPVWVDDNIITGYTCNVLMDRQSPVLENRTFDLSLGQTGGEDTAFFAKFVADGGKIAFSADAVLSEAIPSDRVSFRWLLRRRFRMGQTHGRLVAENGVTARLWAITIGKVVYCTGVAVFQVFMPVRRNQTILRGTLHAGALSGLAGRRMLQQYGPEFTKRQNE